MEIINKTIKSNLVINNNIHKENERMERCIKNQRYITCKFFKIFQSLLLDHFSMQHQWLRFNAKLKKTKKKIWKKSALDKLS